MGYLHENGVEKETAIDCMFLNFASFQASNICWNSSCKESGSEMRAGIGEEQSLFQCKGCFFYLLLCKVELTYVSLILLVKGGPLVDPWLCFSGFGSITGLWSINQTVLVNGPLNRPQLNLI